MDRRSSYSRAGAILLLTALLAVALPAPTGAADIRELVLDSDVLLRHHAGQNGWPTDSEGRIHAGPDLDDYTYVSFRHTTIPLVIAGLTLSGVDLDLTDARSIHVHDLALQDAGRADIRATDVQDLRIENVVFDAPAARIRVDDSSDVRIVGIDNTAGPTELVVRGSSAVTARDSVFRSGSTGVAVVVQDTDELQLRDLFVTARGGDGVLVQRGSQVEVHGLRIDGASGRGMRLDAVDGRVHKNTIADTAGIGIRVTGTSSLDLYHNHMSALGTHGILVHETSSVNIYSNHILGADLGIALHAPGNAVVYDNWLANDDNACKSGPGLVRWAIPPTAGQNIRGGTLQAGNHWADTDLPDGNGDGIGDRPYVEGDQAGPTFLLDGACPGVTASGPGAARQIIVDPFPLV